MKNKNILVGIFIISIIIMFFIGIVVHKNNKEKEEIKKSIVTDVQFWGNKKIANKVYEQSKSKKENDIKEKVENIKKNNNEFYNINYDILKDGHYRYAGGEDDSSKLGIGKDLAKLSTEKSFLPYVNKAVGYLTMGAYEDKIRNQFIGKTWRGMKIKDCDITTYKIHEELGVDDTDILKRKGILNLPSGKFTALAGEYEDMKDNDNIYFVRVVVTFE